MRPFLPLPALFALLGCNVPDTPDHLGADDDSASDSGCDEATDGATYYTDSDGDGYGDDGSAQAACSQPPGTVAVAGDCDDSDATVHPGATETCDGVDEDCDGAEDDDPTDAATYFQDADDDGYGDAANSTQGCVAPAGFVLDGTDCDDGDPSTSPGAGEICGDGADQDCDGADARCHLEGAIVLGDLPDRIAGDVDAGEFGTAISSAGDVNADGNDDLWITALDEAAHGDLALFHGPIHGQLRASDAAATVTGYQPDGDIYAWRGPSLGGGKDLDGDGVPDIAVDDGDGSVLVFSGGLLGTHGTEAAMAVGAGNATWGGTKYNGGTATGDVTGDGLADLVARGGADYSDFTAPSLVIFESPIPAEFAFDDALAVIQSPWNWPDFPGGMDLVDLDGDGIDDLVVGVSGDRWSGDGQPQGLAVYLAPFSGELDPFETDLLVTDADATFSGSANTSTADTDGDGVPDLLIGSESDADSVAAAVFSGALRGQAAPGDALASWVGEGERLGDSVASGDFDADGQPDVLIAAPEGGMYLWYGVRAGTWALDTADVVIGSTGYNEVASVGDLDGDGIDDAAVKDRTGSDGDVAPGVVWPLYGGM